MSKLYYKDHKQAIDRAINKSNDAYFILKDKIYQKKEKYAFFRDHTYSQTMFVSGTILGIICITLVFIGKLVVSTAGKCSLYLIGAACGLVGLILRIVSYSDDINFPIGALYYKNVSKRKQEKIKEKYRRDSVINDLRSTLKRS